MRIEIYRRPHTAAWAPSGPEYSFVPLAAGETPYAAVEVPGGWMLVGDPEPLLVRRTSHSDFTSRTATEALFAAYSQFDGFGFDRPPADGTPADWNRERIGRDHPAPEIAQITGRVSQPKRSLPAPGRNGRRS